MSTAQIIYEQYKVLPKGVWKELRELIMNEEEVEKPKKSRKKSTK